MADIHVFWDPVLLTIVAGGVLSSQDILAVVFDNYPKCGTRYILWDLSRADLRLLTDTDFHDIALATRSVERRVRNVRTAFVTSDGTSLALLRRYIAEAARSHVPTEYAAFLTIEEAKQWLV